MEDLEPWLLVIGGLAVIIGVILHIPADFFMPPEDEE